ncbi:hypothetical protein SAMN02799643_03628 [Methylobacterium sp. UNCCL125]|jgi:hypothetical protein|nr:hypothetical protein SAMN02799643_03628 [Methylobacterium sp. UNCCL125]
MLAAAGSTERPACVRLAGVCNRRSPPRRVGHAASTCPDNPLLASATSVLARKGVGVSPRRRATPPLTHGRERGVHENRPRHSSPTVGRAGARCDRAVGRVAAPGARRARLRRITCQRIERYDDRNPAKRSSCRIEPRELQMLPIRCRAKSSTHGSVSLHLPRGLSLGQASPHFGRVSLLARPRLPHIDEARGPEFDTASHRAGAPCVSPGRVGVTRRVRRGAGPWNLPPPRRTKSPRI